MPPKKAAVQVNEQDIQGVVQEYLGRLERQHLCQTASRLHEAGLVHALATAFGSAAAMASPQGFIDAVLAEEPAMADTDPMRLLGWSKIAAAAIGFVEG